MAEFISEGVRGPLGIDLPPKKWLAPPCNWASEASPPSRTTGTNFLYIYIYVSSLAPVVSPDTVSLLNVSTRFYLGVHAVRNIAILLLHSGLLSLAHNAEAFI